MGRRFGRGSNGSRKSGQADLIAKDEPTEMTPSENAPSTLKPWARRPDYVPGTDPEAEKRIIVPRTDIDITRLLLSFGAEIVAEVGKPGQSTSDHYQVLTLPDSLRVLRGGMGLSNEFQCVDGIEHPGIVPEVICSPDGEVVVAFFETLRGSIQLIGPTWAGTPKRFRDGVPTPLLPSNVMNVTVEDGIEIPQGRDWELLLMGISKLADYPVEERCLRSWATEHGLPSSTNSTGEKFDRYKAQLDFHFSSISFERGRNLQEFLGIQEPAAGLGTSLGDGR